MLNSIETEVLKFVNQNPNSSSKEIFEGIKTTKAYATLKRALTELVSQNYIVATGRGKGTKYKPGLAYEILHPIDVDKYFEKEIDERQIKNGFNFSLIEALSEQDLFYPQEKEQLELLQNKFRQNISRLDVTAYNKEMERLPLT